MGPVEERVYELAFVSDRDGDRDLYIMATDGTGLRRITAGPELESVYEWAPDGTRLAVVRTVGTADIWVVNADGVAHQRLTNTQPWESSPRWCPDGQRIAFSVYRSMTDLYSSDIWVVGADGTGLTNVTQSQIQDAGNGGPEWSPDGGRILFMATRREPYGEAQIYVMNADGSAVVNLSRNPALYHGSPQWSPDGRRILFETRSTGACGSLHTMKVDGSGLVDLTKGPAACDDMASWSPDGKLIAFRRREGENLLMSDIHVVRSDGSGLVNLSNHIAQDSRPSWAPDGSLVAFTSHRDGTDEVYLVKPDGTGLRRLTDAPSGSNWLSSGTGAFRPVR